MGYREVRIGSQDYESAFFVTWIMQVLLSEILDVPVTIESSLPDLNMNLYDVNSSFGYGKGVGFDGLRLGHQVRDCSVVKRTELENYQVCAHVVPEYWRGVLPDGENDLQMSYLGILAGNNWYIPKHTADRDPSLGLYTGLSGERNRRKLAETFRRPMAWKDYCLKVSPNMCQTDDGVASRAPEDESEETSYFVQGLYTGHFAATEKNDCDLNPLTCTGQ
jgi:hypothetical protein